MQRIILVMVVAVALSGCSDSHGLSSYVLTRADVGDFTYTTLDDEAKEAGIQGNPGPIDVRKALEDELDVKSAYMSIFSRPNDTETPLIQSIAILLTSEEIAFEWASETFGCSPDSYLFQKGAIIMTVFGLTFMAEEGDEEAVQAAVDEGAHALLHRTGATDLCADGGPMDEHH